MFYQNLKKLSKYTTKKSIVTLLFLILFSMIIETLSLGLIIPAIAFVTDDDFYIKYSVVVDFLSNLPMISFDNTNYSIDSKKISLIISSLTIILVIYFLKAIILSFINLYQIKFTKLLELNLSIKLFDLYLNQPYTFHLNRNTSMLLRNMDQTNNLANAVYSLIILLSEILILIGIMTLLLIFTTVSTLFTLLFFLFATIIYYLLTKDFLLKWGIERHHLVYLVIKQLQQGFQGIKDVKILGRQNFFLREFNINKTKYYSKLFKSEFIKSLPKIWLEFLAVSVIVGVMLLLFSQNYDLNTIFFSIGVIAAAAFRILPSINRIINCLQNLKNDFPIIENINNELELKKEFDIYPLPKFKYLSNQIIIKNLNYAYNSSKKVSINSINLNIKKGECVGIIGASGSGKSTLLDIILGLLPVENNQINIFGNNFGNSTNSWQKEIGYVSQNIYLTDDSIKKNIALGIDEEKINEEHLLQSIESAQLKKFIQNSDNGIDTFVGERGEKISGGEKQRIGIARALYHNPSLLVLDEATSALDIKTEEEIIKTISNLKRKKTIIIVSHRPSTVKICDTIYKMENGKINKLSHV